jgi:DnaJ-class molecular chaperone
MGVENKCAMCNGTGSVPAGKDGRGRKVEKSCPNCGGDGYIGVAR